MTDYQSIRHALHEHPQTAGNEQFAHDTIVKQLQLLHPDHVYTNVGGWGVVAVWGADPAAPTVAFRADTDALPIGHRCGHDGHTTILMRLAELVDVEAAKCREGSTQLQRNILLLWQPAEETGEGAQAVLESGILQRYNIVRFYALHNIPGYPTGSVVVCPRTFAAASSGVIYHLDGRETHASTPELGINPGLAVAEMVQKMSHLAPAGGQRQATLICIHLGSPAFGTSAGHAEVMFTLRAYSNDDMQQLLDEANAAVEAIASRWGLKLTYALQEPFCATENNGLAVDDIRTAADDIPLKLYTQVEPFRWSEDFGRYLMHYRGAMFGFGSGERQPELHHPDYDFPDAIIEPAARLFLRLAMMKY